MLEFVEELMGTSSMSKKGLVDKGLLIHKDNGGSPAWCLIAAIKDFTSFGILINASSYQNAPAQLVYIHGTNYESKKEIKGAFLSGNNLRNIKYKAENGVLKIWLNTSLFTMLNLSGARFANTDTPMEEPPMDALEIAAV